jgi:hypothetical protein
MDGLTRALAGLLRRSARMLPGGAAAVGPGGGPCSSSVRRSASAPAHSAGAGRGPFARATARPIVVGRRLRRQCAPRCRQPAQLPVNMPDRIEVTVALVCPELQPVCYGRRATWSISTACLPSSIL